MGSDLCYRRLVELLVFIVIFVVVIVVVIVVVVIVVIVVVPLCLGDVRDWLEFVVVPVRVAGGERRHGRPVVAACIHSAVQWCSAVQCSAV